MEAPLLKLDSAGVARTLDALARRIDDANGAASDLALIGVRTGGAHLALRLKHLLDARRASSSAVPLGILDITLYRDDVLVGSHAMPVLRGTDIPFDVEGKTIVLVDDVLFTGRTVRAALDAILDLGRPRAIRLAVLVDRGHRELPIAADYAGVSVETSASERVSVRLVEEGHAEDAVVVSARDAA